MSNRSWNKVSVRGIIASEEVKKEVISMLEKNNYQNNIKQFRVREGLTQEELAKKINTSRQMIGLIENNKTIPSVETALKLAKVLKEPIERLFWL